MRKFSLSLIAVLLVQCAFAARVHKTEIRMNQVGFFPRQEKVAVVLSDKRVLSFKITDSKGKSVMKKWIPKKFNAPFSGEEGYRIDFSSLNVPGEYTLEVNKTKTKFCIKQDVLEPLCLAAIKAYYYQRAGMPIEQRYAGKWSRPAAHMDMEVKVHPSAATAQRPAGTVIPSPKGWYDAGDYNKYIVNSAFAIGQMLNIYPLVEEYVKDLRVNIPESGNYVPDLLNELYYNLEWMLTMQDSDGGVYHKLTTPNFEDFVMPYECKQQRYVVQKSTCASLDFAACMAMASRIYAPYSKQFPDFSKKALEAAKMAYLWALENPTVYYNQHELNQKFSPAINTGTYGDMDATDEFFWASAELYLTTGDEMYLLECDEKKPKSLEVPSWGRVGALGLTSWLMNWNSATKLRKPEVIPLENYAKAKLVEWADAYVEKTDTTLFLSSFGNKATDFHWASLAEGAATRAILLIQAYSVTKDKKYLLNARRNAEYILGRNPLGYCYVTGFGQNSPMHPHHRISAADGIEEPIPGLLVGGPNASANEGKFYDFEQPDKRYADNQGSYMTNEIAINWNSALVALMTSLLTFQDY
ncbi:MAG: glycoside hydrolase family 9 protein [Bacteroidaceae bacterium]|nr:glycoside hydrolase family 9 protein [Bacteroidaceae bacterium]